MAQVAQVAEMASDKLTLLAQVAAMARRIGMIRELLHKVDCYFRSKLPRTCIGCITLSEDDQRYYHEIVKKYYGKYFGNYNIFPLCAGDAPGLILLWDKTRQRVDVWLFIRNGEMMPPKTDQMLAVAKNAILKKVFKFV